MVSAISSYWKVFRMIFVLFSIYLMQDAFFRWDGFRYYASLAEFLPGVALITILWTIIALFAAFLLWIPIRISEWFSKSMGWKINSEHLMLIATVVFLLSALAAAVKLFIWKSMHMTPLLLLSFIMCSLVAAVFIVRLYGQKAGRWMGIIQERFTPLVWLFAAWFILSVPIVTYHTWIKGAEDTIVSQKAAGSLSKPNIILVTFDALTAHDMSVYGYNRPTTPFINKWAEGASVFTMTEAESNYTTPSVASLMTGKRIWTHQTYHMGGSKPVKSKTENFPLLLKQAGYYNIALVASPVASPETLGIENSFDITFKKSKFKSTDSFHRTLDGILYSLFGDKIRMYDWLVKHDFIINKLLRNFAPDFSVTRTPIEKINDKFLEIIDNTPQGPFFTWIHFFPPHLPYLPPGPFMGMFDTSSALRSFKTQMKARNKAYVDAGKGSFGTEMKPIVETLRARYDEYIRYCDSQFEYLIVQMSKRDRLQNNIVILSSDHGESFEHGVLEHIGEFLYEPVTNIPLIIKEPGQTEGRTINQVVEQIDISATILDLAGIAAPSWIEGRSLSPLMHGKNLQPRPSFSVYLEKNPSRGHQITKGLIAVREDEYKLVHDLKTKKSLLFNLEKDPAEQQDLIEEEPGVGHRLLTLIQDNIEQANKKIVNGR